MATDVTRRDFLGTALVATTAASVGCKTFTVSTPKRPNFLFVLADDWSYPHAGAYGDFSVNTPTFDRIAREGVLFTHSFCASPSCTPSRSAILAGRQLYRCGEAGLLFGSIPQDLPLVTHALEDAGYFVGFTGKGWGPGDAAALGNTRSPTGKPFQDKRHVGELSKGIDGRDLAANFSDFLAGRPKDAPFFFWLGSLEPHRDFALGAGQAEGKKLSDARVPPYWPDVDLVRSDILDYYAEVEWFDRQLERTLKVLEDSGELENTMIVVTSDNGMAFPRAKANLYDAGVRMPLAIRWGKQAVPARRVDDLVSHTDFAATFLEAAGLPLLPGSTGTSLMPLLTSNERGVVDPKRDEVVLAFERHTLSRPEQATYPMRALRTRDYLYVRNFEPDRWPTGGPDYIGDTGEVHADIDASPTKHFLMSRAGQAAFPGQTELCLGKRPAEELYNLRSDPYQLRNLAKSEAAKAILARHRDRLEAVLHGEGDPRIDGKDPWQSYAYHRPVAQRQDPPPSKPNP